MIDACPQCGQPLDSSHASHGGYQEADADTSSVADFYNPDPDDPDPDETM